MSVNTKTIAFLGGSTGVGLSTLKHSIAAGYQCIALCRDPSKLTSIFAPELTPNLTIVSGNAHNTDAVSKCIVSRTGNLVDLIITTIGSRPVLSKLTIEDPNCCRKGAATMLEALTLLRRQGVAGSPHIVAFSTTGLSRFGRDVPFAMVPIYHVMLKVPHEDKRIMEDTFVESGEPFTIIRASMLTNNKTDKAVRVGTEDPKNGLEGKVAIGYSISREDAGKWIAENFCLVSRPDEKYINKIATITC
ncbi:hypothetical protein N7492_007644 [Penicillium capsulatum]|uniref:NAD(P)-binding domain-containing protein n=1 Tax=Penicillium capsulatum TaxID=69766 RepID=A0A9W9I2U4_9EURO|nr:hypothetical protein N7492_007644 [Penicillium capsulatum]KAJ6117478.1 hypothetical protein N7512_007203 [Penicillium capsulatum]